MSRNKPLSLLKVLIALAWKDGHVSQSEINIFKRVYRKFELSQEEISQLTPVLESPPTDNEVDIALKQMADEWGGDTNRALAMEFFLDLIEADGVVTNEEKELLGEIEKSLESSSVAMRSFAKLKNALSGLLGGMIQKRETGWACHFKETIEKKVRLVAKDNKSRPDLNDPSIYDMVLMGTLMSNLVNDDDEFSDVEFNAILTALENVFPEHKEQVLVLMHAIQDQEMRGFDFYEVITEFNNRFPYDKRKEHIDLFFEVALAEGELSHAKNEKIRKITKAMMIPHSYFTERKLRALEGLNS